MKSASGFDILPRNCRAYAERLSTYRRWPSAYRVSNASDDFPEPDNPVMTTSLLRGISPSTFLRLFTRAPFISIFLSAINVALVLTYKVNNLFSAQRFYAI